MFSLKNLLAPPEVLYVMMGFYTTVSYELLEINTTRSMQFRATHSTLLAYPGHNLGTDWEHQRANSENTQNTFRDFSEGT